MQTNDAEPLRLLAVDHMKAGRYQEAADVLRKAVVVSPQDDNLWRILGGALSNIGESQNALDAFSQAIAIAPNVARNHFNFGRCSRTAWALRRCEDMLPGSYRA